MRRSLLKICICSILFIAINELHLLSQSFNDLYNTADKKSRAKIDKALNKISQAGKLTQEANNYYSEALSLQMNTLPDEKTLQKKLVKAEGSAIKTQIRADKLYTSAYNELYDVCIRILNQSAMPHEEGDRLIQSAYDLRADAEAKRKGADKNKNVYEKAALLNDAAGFESVAIDNLILAIQIQHGAQPAVSDRAMYPEPYFDDYSEMVVAPIHEPEIKHEYPSSIQLKSENLAIDQKVVDKYNNYIKESGISDPITISRSGVRGVSEVSVGHAREIFYNYHMGADYYFTERGMHEEILRETPNDSAEQLALFHPEVSEKYYPVTNGKMSDSPDRTESYRREAVPEGFPGASVSKEVVSDSRYAFDISSIVQETDINFMVQIAASRVPLTRTQLWAIFPGNYTVEVIQEDGWYKYRVTGFRLFSEAHRVALESGVKGAWVVSYHNNRQISLTQAREMTRVIEKDVKRYGRGIVKEPTDYYVQVLASKFRLSEEQLINFCGSAGICREIIEEGWFKYQIYAGTRYERAVELKNQLPVKSFIVAYESGTKVSLRKAIHKNQ